MSAIDFTQPYKRETFLDFLQHTFLPEDFEITEQDLYLEFKPKYIQEVCQLGTCPEMGLNIYEILHQSEHDPRVSLTKETFQLMKQFDDFNALVVFKHSDSSFSDNYRFSYVTMGLKPEGKKFSYEYSNPRRYSYFLGPDAKVNTPTRFLLNRGRVADMDVLENRFSVEVVNKEFYSKIAELFTKLVDGKQEKGAEAKGSDGLLQLPFETDRQIKQEFTVRMIGRIIFCWFLKKKTTSKGEPLIPDEILSKKAVEENRLYYHNILEKLFFLVLNTQQDKRLPEIQNSPFASIPFLNGGLFEPQKGDFYVPNGMGNSTWINKLIVPDEWLKDFFELLEMYNFTIDENTSIDLELSVDPEMLGQIFENLLAEINPDTGETSRKSTGSFYTPRPIVEYMVDESLKQYLKTKAGIDEDTSGQLLSYSAEAPKLGTKKKYLILNAIDNIKIIDPACGSGAFPMGILQKLVLILERVDPDALNWTMKMIEKIKDPEDREDEEKRLMEEEWNFRRKLGLIKNSIYGVDSQQIAVEISKLRVFLSLVVDSKVSEEAANRGIQTLPNLEFKFVCADSLIGLLKKGENKVLYDTEHIGINVKPLTDKLRELRFRYFSSSGADKKEFEDAYLKTQTEIVEALRKTKWNLGSSDVVKVAAWNPFKNEDADFTKSNQSRNDWFDPEWMFGITDGFDIVIGNPPYVQIQKFKGKEIQDKWAEQGYETFTKTGDIYCLFYERGVELLKPKGILTYISSNKWMRTAYGKKMRIFLTKLNPLKLIDFTGYSVFESATVVNNILMVENALNQRQTKACAIDKKFTPSTDIQLYFDTHHLVLDKLSEQGWSITSIAESSIRKKMKKAGTPLQDWDVCVNVGIKTGYNKAFIIDANKKEELIAKDPKSTEILKPVLRGEDIKRYAINYAGLWMIATFPSLNININDFPAVKDYLSSFGKRLNQTGEEYVDEYGETRKSRKKTCNKWFETQDQIGYYKEFQKEKIVWGNLSLNSKFALSKGGHLVNVPAPLITPGNKYILAVLNSNAGDFYIRSLGVTRSGGYFEYKPMFVEQLPIPKIPDEAQKPYESLVDYVMSAKENDLKLQAAYFEQVIDGLVFELYFSPELKAAGKEILKHLGELTPFTEGMTDEEKLAVVQKEFDRLYDTYHPLRNNLDTLDSIDEIKTIKEALK